MINCQELATIFKKNDLTFFTGVPDSTFKDWMNFLADKNGLKNVISCNECEAAAIASGYHLATGKMGIIYMQNSGLGKIVNPHTSLLSKDVYSIPAIYMIGWRGEPEKSDEPQHKMMGRIMFKQLEILEIPYTILPDNILEAEGVIMEMKQKAEQNQSPVALIIKKGTFEEYKSQTSLSPNHEMTREDAIKEIVRNFRGSEIVVSTTGKTSRELFEYREELKQSHENDFLTVGSMGCASAIALGIATQKPNKKVYVFDGDGAALMQMGTFATIGNYKPANFQHIIFDNYSYDSTGGQPTVSQNLDFGEIAFACGYTSKQTVKTIQELNNAIQMLENIRGPNLIVVKVNKDTRNNLGRPTTTPLENKKAFINCLEK